MGRRGGVIGLGPGCPSSATTSTFITPMLIYCWASVADAGPTLNQHWCKCPCLLDPGLADRFSHWDDQHRLWLVRKVVTQKIWHGAPNADSKLDLLLRCRSHFEPLPEQWVAFVGRRVSGCLRTPARRNTGWQYLSRSLKMLRPYQSLGNIAQAATLTAAVLHTHAKRHPLFLSIAASGISNFPEVVLYRGSPACRPATW